MTLPVPSKQSKVYQRANKAKFGLRSYTIGSVALLFCSQSLTTTTFCNTLSYRQHDHKSFRFFNSHGSRLSFNVLSKKYVADWESRYRKISKNNTARDISDIWCGR